MQKTKFPIEIIIHDDASIDNTARVIKEYERAFPEFFVAIYQSENQYSKGIRPLQNIVFPLVKGKYIALCEGDDYWTDPYKLQKQADYLEWNTDVGLCHTEADVKYEKIGNIVTSYYRTSHIRVPDSNILENIFLAKYPIFTCSVLFRAELLNKIDLEMISKFVAGDYFLWINFARITKFDFIEESTVVRRVVHESATQSTDLNTVLNFWLKDYEMYKYFMNKNLIDAGLESKVHWLRAGRVLDVYFRMGNEKAFNDYYRYLKKSIGQNEASFVLKCLFLFSKLNNGFRILNATKLYWVLHKTEKLQKRFKNLSIH